MARKLKLAVNGQEPSVHGCDADEALQVGHELVEEHGKSVRIIEPVGGFTLARIHPDGGIDVVGRKGREVYGSVLHS